MNNKGKIMYQITNNITKYPVDDIEIIYFESLKQHTETYCINYYDCYIQKIISIGFNVIFGECCLYDGCGAMMFLKDGLLHNLNGPAITFSDEETHYLVDGLYHRDDGPSVDNTKFVKWELNGHTYSFSNWCKELHLTEEEISFYKLKYDV